MAAPVRPVRRRRPVARSPLVSLLRGAGVVLAILATLGSVAPMAVAASSVGRSSSARAGAGTPCVGVVVDGRLAGSTLRTGCATGDPRSGLAALTKAGFSYAFTPRSPGLVCQIDGLPSCAATGARTYWSYWWRGRGSSRWVYSNEGAGTRDPEPGDTEAWVWQDGGRRTPPSIGFLTICPQAEKVATRSAPASSSPSATPRTASSSTRPSATPTSAPRSSTPSRTRRPSPIASSPTASSSIASSPAPSAAGTPSTTSTTPAAASSSTNVGGGQSWIGPLVGAGAVVLLGGATVARFRRTPGGSP